MTTLNDNINNRRIVTFGEILMRLSPPNHLKLSQTSTLEVHYGGAEANVAASLSVLGIKTQFVTSVPDNELGSSAINMMRSFGVTPIVLNQGNRLGVYYFEHGASERPGKVLYDRSGSSFSQLQKGMIDWESIFETADWFHWSGITAALSLELAEVCEEALIIASRMGLPISADLNYRSSLWNYGKKASEIMPNLVQYCDVLLGGVDDSEKCLDVKISTLDSKEIVFGKWMESFPKLKTIVSTARYYANASSNGISAVLCNGKEMFESKKYNISHIVDRIGTGDAFMAGILYGMIQWPNDSQRALEFATAASCLKHSIVGDINLVTVEEVEALMNGASGSRVVR
ncbi:PfkB family carbohydrate kinase [Flavobacterium sp. DSR3-2]|uniref:PfkB family carbohydrate kinase n=1 Tax=Flavobacterium sp. DSR3-2 TaxID=2804634 RepID=UPI003CED0F7C